MSGWNHQACSSGSRAEIRRCRAPAAPDRLGFHLAQAVGVALQWSWPQVRIVVPVPTSSPAESWSLPTQMRTDTRSKFEFPIRTRKFLFFAENSLSTPKNSLFHYVGNLAASHRSCTRVGIGKIPC